MTIFGSALQIFFQKKKKREGVLAVFSRILKTP